MSGPEPTSVTHVAGLGRVTRRRRSHGRTLDQLLRLLSSNDASVRVHHGADEVELPAEVRLLVRDALEGLVHGSDVAVVEVDPSADEEISTQEAADILNVSRPHVVKLCRTHQLAHHMVGNRHRLYRPDVQTYKATRDRDRNEALTAIAEYGPDEF